MDTLQLLALLDHMDLVHETEDGMYLMPGKLPLHGDEVGWDVKEAYDVKGISIVCADEIDIFNPSLFPCIQKKLLDEHRGSTVISRSTVKCTLQFVEVLVQLSKHKEAISVAVMCRNEKALKDAYRYLEYTVGLIETELFKKSAGTNFDRCYISQIALRRSINLDNVWGYKEDDLVEAEQTDGLLRKDPGTRPEDITTIVFKGYEDVVLKRFGAKCRYDWLPVDAVKRCFNRLDVINEWLEDYRSVAKLLRLADYEVEQVVKRSESQHRSVTSDLIQEWCDKTKRKMTIGMLRKLLSRMGLVDNVDALQAVDEVIEMFPGMVSLKKLYARCSATSGV